MKRNISDVHSPALYIGKQLLCKVKPRGRCGGRAYLPRVNGLIALLVLQLFGDIGRQRHLTYLIEDGINARALIEKLSHAVAVGLDFGYLGSELSAAEDESSADLCLLAGTADELPFVIALLFEQQEFYKPAASFLLAIDTGGQHAGIVED